MVVTHILCFASLLYILSTVINFVYKDKLWFDESMSVSYGKYLKKILLFPLRLNSSLN